MLDLRLLPAVLDRIVPADDFPSASDVGTVGFVTRLLDLDLLPRREEIVRLLAAIESLAPDFDTRPADEQDKLLATLEQGEHRAAFALLVEITLEGFYTNAASWQMVGYRTRVPGQMR